MNYIVQNKWLILICLQVLAWSSTFFMLYARYGINSPRLFKLGTVLTILTEVIPQVTLGIVNFIPSRKIDLFTAIIVLLIIYGSTLGRKKIKQLDLWAKNKFQSQQKQPYYMRDAKILETQFKECMWTVPSS